jgi:RND family efflux transporter, MFP subunit
MYRLFVLASIGIVCFTGCSDETTTVDSAAIVRPAKIVFVEPVGENPLRIFPGTVEASVKSDLAFRVGGLLESLPALPGMEVKKGALLAQLDDADYRNTVQDRRAKYSLAKSQYDKVMKLRKHNHVSEDQVDQVAANFDAAQAALSLAEHNLKHTHLTAPFDGVVANVQTENHQVVNAFQTVMELRGQNSLDVRFSIPESLLGKLRRIDNPSNLCAQVRFNAFAEKTFKACFKEYESTPDRLTRTYSVVYSMPTVTEIPVLPGMAVTVETDLTHLMRDEFKKGVLVPISAVFEQAEQTFVWTVDDTGATHKQAVTVASIQGSKLIVLDGLTVNDAVIAVGVTYIQEGMKVRPMIKERGL